MTNAIIQPATLQRNARTRISSDSAWPLRRADGTRWCDKAAQKKETHRD